MTLQSECQATSSSTRLVHLFPGPKIMVMNRVCSLGAYSKSIWLFTLSDIKTIILPTTGFGISSAIAAECYGLDASIPTLGRVPLVVFWCWVNLLPFNIDNQRSPDSIAEDQLNKPWRTLPSRRMTPGHATLVMYMFYPLALVTSAALGGLWQCIALMFLGWCYNGLKGSEHPVVRNMINACGFASYTSGALEVALGYSLPFNAKLGRWICVIAAVVFTSVHSQDMSDQAGDRIRGRKTIPLVMGDVPARYTIAVSMCFWSTYCSWYWNLPALMYLPFAGCGITTAARTLYLRSVQQDKDTFKLWNFWMMLLYILPFLKLCYYRAG